MTINVKILSLGTPERYTVRRTVLAAQQDLLPSDSHLEVNITEVADADQIVRYASVLVLPTLVINEKVVCSRRFPSREEVANWLSEAIDKTQNVKRKVQKVK
jgi:Thioredoxin domain